MHFLEAVTHRRDEQKDITKDLGGVPPSTQPADIVISDYSKV